MFLKIKLQEILDNQSKTIYSLSKETGVAQNNLSKLVKGETTSIKYDILEKLCIALKITPNEIFEIDYPYPKNQIYSKSLVQNYNEEENEQSFDPTLDLSPDELEKYKQSQIEFQERFEQELNLDKSISIFIDTLIEGLFSNLNFDSSVKEAFQNSKGYDYFTTNVKVHKFYNYFYRLLSHYANKTEERFINFLNSIEEIYTNGGLEKVPDDELRELSETLKFLMNESKQKE